MASKKGRSRKIAMVQGGMDFSAPDFDKIIIGHPEWQSELIRAMNYANYVFEVKDCKSFAHEYVKTNLGLSVKPVPEWEFRHKGAICWILTNGGEIENKDQFHTSIKDLILKYKDAPNDSKVVDLSSMRQKVLDDKTNVLIGELEGIIDDVVVGKSGIVNPIEWYRTIGTFKDSDVRKHFKAQLDEIAVGGEGYDDMDPTHLNRVKVALTFILKQLDDFKQVKDDNKTQKIVKRAKVKKIVPSKMVRKLKYKRSDPDYNLKSVPAEKIVTADALWVFDVKKRKMIHYVAQDKVGLLVKGTSIINFDPEQSLIKSLRSPEKFFAALEKAGKVEQRSLLTSLKGKGKTPSGRLNENCVLVKVY